jgi:hypothetical protein
MDDARRTSLLKWILAFVVWSARSRVRLVRD